MKKGILYLLIVFAGIAAMTSCNNKNVASASTSYWSDSCSWYKPKAAYDSTKIDVIYFVSTAVLSAKDSAGNVSWQSFLTDDDMPAINGEIAWVEANMFANDFNFSSPYYHQYTFDAITKLPADSFAVVYKKVVDDACEAFDYYFEHVNHGRPFVIAGFSQGAMITLDVVKHMNKEQLGKMIAAYSIGYRLSKEDLEHPNIVAANGETDTGVVVSFNSVQAKDATWAFVSEGAATAINPINWRTDATPASFTFEWGDDKINNVAKVDTNLNVIMVETDNPSYYQKWMEAATPFMEAGVSKNNLHHWDLLFYASRIHDNALKRAKQN